MGPLCPSHRQTLDSDPGSLLCAVQHKQRALSRARRGGGGGALLLSGLQAVWCHADALLRNPSWNVHGWHEHRSSPQPRMQGCIPRGVSHQLLRPRTMHLPDTNPSLPFCILQHDHLFTHQHLSPIIYTHTPPLLQGTDALLKRFALLPATCSRVVVEYAPPVTLGATTSAPGTLEHLGDKGELQVGEMNEGSDLV